MGRAKGTGRSDSSEIVRFEIRSHTRYHSSHPSSFGSKTTLCSLDLGGCPRLAPSARQLRFFPSYSCFSHNGNDHLCMICVLFLIWPFHHTLFRFLSTGDSNGETDGFRFAGSTRRLPYTEAKPSLPPLAKPCVIAARINKSDFNHNLCRRFAN